MKDYALAPFPQLHRVENVRVCDFAVPHVVELCEVRIFVDVLAWKFEQFSSHSCCRDKVEFVELNTPQIAVG